MPGGFNYEWFRQQTEGIQMISNMNAQKAIRKGLPDRDTEKKVRRRERARRLRYALETEGFGRFLRQLFSGDPATQDMSESPKQTRPFS